MSSCPSTFTISRKCKSMYRHCLVFNFNGKLEGKIAKGGSLSLFNYEAKAIVNLECCQASTKIIKIRFSEIVLGR